MLHVWCERRSRPLFVSPQPICFLNGCGPTKCSTKQQMKCRAGPATKSLFVILISLNASHYVMVNTINKLNIWNKQSSDNKSFNCLEFLYAQSIQQKRQGSFEIPSEHFSCSPPPLSLSLNSLEAFLH